MNKLQKLDREVLRHWWYQLQVELVENAKSFTRASLNWLAQREIAATVSL